MSKISGHLPTVLCKSDVWPGVHEPQARLIPALCPCRALLWESERAPSVQEYPPDV